MRRIVLFAITAAPAFFAAGAHAGVLSKVVDGLAGAAGGGSSSGSKGGGGGGGEDIVTAVLEGIFSGNWSDSRSGNDPVFVVNPGYAPYPTSAAATAVRFYGGLQSVEGSNGSLTMELRVTYDDLGIALRGTGFYEQVGSGDEAEHVHLDIGTLGATYCALRDESGRTELWVDAGLGGVSTVDDLLFLGVYLGAHVEHRLHDEIAVGAEARYFVLEDSVTIIEAAASARLSILRIAYRIVDFNVGPPLRGPEVGLVLSF